LDVAKIQLFSKGKSILGKKYVFRKACGTAHSAPSTQAQGPPIRLLRQAQEPNQGPWNIKKDPNCMVVWIFLCTFALEINNHT
jgi:hypothetical protein